MANRRSLAIAAAAFALVVALVIFINPVGLVRAGQPEIVRGEPNDAARGQALCAAQSTVDEIERVMFAGAIEDGENSAETLRRLESDSIARMEAPVLVRYDQVLRRASCEGRIVIELPRGVESAFGDQRRLTATLEYDAQPAADGSGTVVSFDGAEDAIAMLAEADLRPVRFRRERLARAPEKPVFDDVWFGQPRHDPYAKPEDDRGYDLDVEYVPYPGYGPDYGPAFNEDNGFSY